MEGESASQIFQAMREQWVSMTGMASMFIGTILISLFIQPIYNFEEVRAFGEEGTTELKFIFFELFMIFLFTVIIIWLARKGLNYLIKGFIMLALGISLFYTIWPIALILRWIVMISTEFDISPTLLNMFAILSTIGLMTLLHKFPEWYVVNGVGVLVGAGVITLLGVAFTPILIIIFMIIAAFYDHWAVNKSKHMLELADTMIDLKLPVLLVAPKERGYSFRKENEKIMQDDNITLKDNSHNKTEKKSRDALFMGLGDVIFPGILVISSVTFLPEIGPVVFDMWGEPTIPIHLGPMLVGLGTLFGGLCGYLALMTQVARGKPQAGLPLLNGGSILGYIIFGTIAIGFDQLWHNITFF
ncbi:MAG: presenilin family intramembrane aspartyl protease PSH [Candidatus Poseidoniales archaeon]|jgi:presenilin-like A22 family membrane protease|tara:strand:+ start:2292 stop:3365 length:1074 start_codon:yes stop_codon:yes gene_type:complete